MKPTVHTTLFTIGNFGLADRTRSGELPADFPEHAATLNLPSQDPVRQNRRTVRFRKAHLDRLISENLQQRVGA